MLFKSSSSCGGSSSSDSFEGSTAVEESPPPPPINRRLINETHKDLAVLSGHVGGISCLALCGEFLLSASLGRDIIVWQQPDLRRVVTFGNGSDDGSVKALAALGTRLFTAHHDGRIRVWKLSTTSENIFRLTATLPTTKDYLNTLMTRRSYVQTRRHHRRLWIQHADSISCLAVHDGVIYSGSWDKTLKVWSVSDFTCLESIKAHDDAINALTAHKGAVFSASADGKIKIWSRDKSQNKCLHRMKAVLEGKKEVSWNSVIVCDDGRLVYGGGSDGKVLGWGPVVGGGEQWRVVCEVKAHEMAVLCMCAMGQLVCSGSADRSIGVWKKRNDGGLWKVRVIRGHEGPVKCLQGSVHSVGNGFMLYSGGLDKSLRVWWVPMEYGDDGGEKEFDEKLSLR